MVIWARKFYESRQQWPQLPWCEQLPPYLDNLKKKGVQQWQIVQAELAVRVYFTNYLTSACKETTSPSSISFTEVNDKKFARILENFKEISTAQKLCSEDRENLFILVKTITHQVPLE